MHPELAALIDAIYETALDPSVWPRVMEMVTGVLGGTCSSVVVSNFETGAIPFATHDPALPQEAIAAYMAHFVTCDTVRQTGDRLPVGVAQTEEEFLGPWCAEVYNDFYVQFDWFHILGMYLLRQAPLGATLSVYRSRKQAAFSERETRIATLISGHLGRAVKINQKLAQACNERDMVFDAVERLAVGVVFVDTTGRILLMNGAAREITSERDGLAAERGTLAGNTPASTKRIRELVGSALRHSIDMPASLELAIGRPSRKRPYILLASPLSVPDGSPAKAMILITDTDRALPPPAETLRSIYSLTPAEAALAIALCQGRTTKEVALERGVSMNTVHTQLMNVQRKLGANRQAEIVSLLLRGPVGMLRRERD